MTMTRLTQITDRIGDVLSVALFGALMYFMLAG